MSEMDKRHAAQLLELQREAASTHLSHLRTMLLALTDSLSTLKEYPEALETKDAREKLAELKMMLVRVQALLHGQP